MSDTPYSDDLIDLVAAASDEPQRRGEQHDTSRCLSCRARAVKILTALDAEGVLLTDERRRSLLGDPAALAGWTPEQIRQHEEFNASLPALDDDA